jgi:diguanylate cyclase (GGDEF)-like protein
MALEAQRLLKELVQLGLALHSERDLTHLLELILTAARHFSGADAGTLYLRDGETLTFSAVQNDELARRYGGREMRRRLTGAPLALAARVLASYVARTGELLNLPHVDAIPADRPYAFDPSVDRRLGYQTDSVLVVPLRTPSGSVAGVLQLINARDEQGRIRAFDAETEDLIRLLAALAVVALRNVELEELSFRDPVTGAFNRRYLMLRLREELSRFERGQEPLSLVLFDLDQFKEINDTHGHDVGDAVLRSVAQLLMNQSREYTVIARYGGDEFAALLPGTSKEGAMVYAERMRRIIESYPFRTGRVTTSIGTITLPDDVARGEDLVAAADASLYQAKRGGRNRVGSGAVALQCVTDPRIVF